MATLVAIGSAPVFVLIVDLATGRQRLHPRLAAALLCTALGLVAFIGTPPAGIEPGAALIGCGLAILAGMAFALISLMGARPDPDFDDVTGTALAFGVGGVVVLGAAAAAGGPVLFAPTPSAVTLALLLGLIPSAVAYWAYLTGLRSQSSTTGVLVALLEPVTGAVLAAVVLGERLAPIGVAGAVLLLVAVVLVAMPARGQRDRWMQQAPGSANGAELGVGQIAPSSPGPARRGSSTPPRGGPGRRPAGGRCAAAPSGPRRRGRSPGRRASAPPPRGAGRPRGRGPTRARSSAPARRRRAPRRGGRPGR